MLQTSARKLLLSLLLLPLAACANTQQIQLPATNEILDKMPKVQNSGVSPCWQQEQIAAQNSYLASIKEKKEVVYSAPCKSTPQKVAKAG